MPTLQLKKPTDNRLDFYDFNWEEYVFDYEGKYPVTHGPIRDDDKKFTYEGEWNSEDEKHGRGVQLWDNGTIYEGYWSHDKPHGKGRIVFHNGDVY